MRGVALRREFRAKIFPLCVPVVFIALLHCVFLGSTRYNLPAMSFLIIIAAAFLDRVIAAFARKRAQN